MNCPFCQSELPGYEAQVCPSCGKTLPSAKGSIAEAQPGPGRLNWLLFFALLLAPPLLTILAVQGGRRTNDLAAGIAIVGGGAGGLLCGMLLGNRFGTGWGAKAALGLVLAVPLGVLCIGMCCFGCLAGGYKLDLK